MLPITPEARGGMGRDCTGVDRFAGGSMAALAPCQSPLGRNRTSANVVRSRAYGSTARRGCGTDGCRTRLNGLTSRLPHRLHPVPCIHEESNPVLERVKLFGHRDLRCVCGPLLERCWGGTLPATPTTDGPWATRDSNPDSLVSKTSAFASLASRPYRVQRGSRTRIPGV